ncbi:hypothetical protein X772_12065 [Mesorhizobium sp. LSJC280B00]|nr:hypothetical protein X772_12065 [Mesorhizobium sp. LSJC280B00]
MNNLWLARPAGRRADDFGMSLISLMFVIHSETGTVPALQ